MYESIVFVVRVRCRRKESSRSLSQLLMSFLLVLRPHFKSQHFRSFISQCQNGSVHSARMAAKDEPIGYGDYVII